MKNTVSHRSELHCRSVFSAMNGVAMPKSMIRQAGYMEMPAVAITDDGSVNAFSEIEGLRNRKNELPLKVIMGATLTVEGKEISVLVKNDKGRKNLYKLISKSNLTKRDTEKSGLTWAEIVKHQSGLLIGSGTENGMLYQKLEHGEELTADLAVYFDYIEVLPLSCLTAKNISSEEAKRRTNSLLAFAEKNSIKAVAVSDAYCFEPDDAVVMNILRTASETGTSTYCRNEKLLSTEEMLKEFSFLEENKAKEIVVDNSNAIAKMCEEVHADVGILEYPVLADADERLRKICLEQALHITGGAISPELSDRLEWELAAIKKTGMAFIFLQLKELITKSPLRASDVEIRGTAAGSMVLYLCGIGDVNPMEYHISPYFTYGYNQDKLIDIDLEVPVDFQERALETLKGLEGLSTVIRAGMYITLSEAKAERMLDDYENKYGKLSGDERIHFKGRLQQAVIKPEICPYPDKVIFIPKGKEIEDATPVSMMSNAKDGISQREYYSFNDVFYTQDICAGKPLQMAYNLFHRTGVKPSDITFRESEIVSILESTDCLGVDSEQILRVVSVKSFDDMVRIVSLACGTNTWTDNAEILIRNGIAGLDEVISTREDIFDYLTEIGMKEECAYKISERVRKGRGLLSDDMKKMLELGVPDWYLESCNKIHYLQSRASSVSRVKTMWRLAYFKIHYPSEFYEEYYKYNSSQKLK